MSSLRLDLLPNEIIQRIFAQGPCSNALALRSVCQKFKTICSDPSLYISIIENSNEIVSTGRSTTITKWPGLGSLRNEKDWRVCARYALADMYLASYLYEDINVHVDLTNLCRSVWKWLPELIATGHKQATANGVKIVRETRLNHFLSQVEQEVSDALTWTPNRQHYNEIAVRLIFISVCDSFRNAVTGDLAFGSMRQVREIRDKSFHYFPPLITFVIEAYLPMIQRQYAGRDSLFNTYAPTLDQTNAMTTWLSKADQQLHWSRCMMLCMVISAVLYDCTRRSQSSTSGSLTSNMIRFDAFLGLPPSPTDIPFNDIYQTSPPFERMDFAEGPNRFAISHLPKMTSASFLEDGMWCGYCFNEHIAESENYSVHDLSLKVTSDFADHCTIEGDCERMMNSRMTLTGTLFKQSGWAQLNVVVESTNVQNPVDSWSVMITPFGIIGSWRYDNSAGWVWLWKKTWQSLRV